MATNSSSERIRKTFILNPHAVLSSSESLLSFGEDNEVIIPMAVLERLQETKKTLTLSKRKIARQILEYIDSFNTREITSEKGVVQANGSILRIATNYKDITVNSDSISDPDKRALQVALGVKKEGKNVTFITNNPILRIKAKILGIDAEPYKDELFPKLEQQYKGRINCFATKAVISDLYNGKSVNVEDIYEYNTFEWVNNMYLHISCESSNICARFDGEKIVELENLNLKSFNIAPKNIGQKLALDALLNEDTKLTILKGPAGTGKTFCSLGVALQQTMQEKKYEKILISVPVQTIGDEQIGFLPGDIDEKMAPYIGGVVDNLNQLLKKFGINKTADKLLEEGLVDIQPIGYLRGRNISDYFYIIDEAQNVDPDIIKPIVSRAAEGSKFVFLGDASQVDSLKLNERYNGIVYLSEKAKGSYNGCRQMLFTEEEIVRGDLAEWAVKALR